MCIKNTTKGHKMANNQIWQWAHMLDESKHASYYEVYMQEHPEDKLPTLIDSLIEEFAKSLKKDLLVMLIYFQIRKNVKY